MTGADVSSALTGLDFLVIGCYLVALMAIGFRAGGRKDPSHDLFLGGRNLSWPGIGFSIFSSNVTPVMLVSFAGLAYSTGIVGSNFEWLAWPFLAMLSLLFAPFYLRHGIRTMPEFLRLRYGEPSYHFLAYYALVSILLVWIAGSLYAGSLIISQLLGWELWVSVVLITVVATSYTMAGGLEAIVKTDVFQSVIIIASSVVLLWMALDEIGSVERLVDGVPPEFWELGRPVDDPDYPWHALLLGYPVVAVYFFCTDQFIVQKMLAARDIAEVHKAGLFTAYLKILMPLLFLFPGIAGRILYPDLADPDLTYGTMVTGLLPNGLIGLVVAALLAALINTIAAGLNSFSTIFTLDIYLTRVNPAADEARQQRVGRATMLLTALLAVAAALLFSRISKNLFEIVQGIMSLLAPPLTVVFLLGVLWKRMHSRAAEWVLYFGGTLCILVGAAFVAGYPSAEFWPGFLMLSFYLFAGLLLLAVGLSLVTTGQRGIALPSIVATYREGNTAPSPGVWALWGLLALVMAGLYTFFN